MASGAFVIFVSDAAWRVGIASGDATRIVDIPGPAEPTLAHSAEASGGVLRANGYRDGEGVLLALPSQWCLCADVSGDDLPRKQRRQAMSYRLEEKLPLAAEDVAADFVARDGGVLGVCVRTERVAPILDALGANGVSVDHISPAALLALQHAFGPRQARGSDCDVLIWGRDGHADLFLLIGGMPAEWFSLPQEPRGVALRLAVLAAGRESPLRIRLTAVAPDVARAVSELSTVRPAGSDDADLFAAATAAAGDIKSGKIRLWVDLRRDGLAEPDASRKVRAPLRFAAAAALLFLVALGGAMLWRSTQYARLARGYADEQRAVFRRTFPGQAVPDAPASRLASEERKLRALVGGGGGAARQASALLLLREALVRLPDDVRYHVSELRIEEGKLHLEGQTRSHGDAEAILAALRSKGGFVAELPRSDQAGPAIAFTIEGVPERAAPRPQGREQ